MKQPEAFSYIRFSHPDQSKGHSEQRQVEAAKKYAEKRGLKLNTIKDLGFSGGGEHRTKGALGKFLQLVQANEIASGSLFIIEDADRFSRENWLVAIPQFMQVIQAGITIVVLGEDEEDHREFNAESDWDEIEKFINDLKLAHKENTKKSNRVSKAWAKMIKELREKGLTEKDGEFMGKKGEKVWVKLTKKAPKWLTLSNDKKSFVAIPEAELAIKRIFEMRAAGTGAWLIAKELNDSRNNYWKPPKWSRNENGGWRQSYIRFILQSRTVLGEFQPHLLIKVDGKKKRVPLDPIERYYPPVVKEGDFLVVKAMIEENKDKPGFGGGRPEKVKNLFTSILKCGLCKSAMHWGADYLYCYNASRNLGCQAKYIKYEHFEGIIFKYLREFDFSKFLPEPGELQKKLNQLEVSIKSASQEVKDITRFIENLDDAIMKADNESQQGRFIEKQKKELERQGSIKQRVGDLTSEYNKLKDQKDSPQHKADAIIQLHDLLATAKTDDERILIRSRLRLELQRLLEHIYVWHLENQTPSTWGFRFESDTISRISIKFKDKKLVRILSNAGSETYQK